MIINQKIRIKIFENFNDELLFLWKDLEKDSLNTCFQSYKYIEQYIKYFNKKNIQTKILSVELNDKLIAIFPLEIKFYFGLKILRWIGTGDFDYCGPILSKKKKFDKDLFFKVWGECLKSIGSVDLILLKKQLNFIENSKNPFFEFLKNFNYSKIYLIRLPDQYENYILNFKNKKFLAEFLRTKRKISENYNILFKQIPITNNDLTVADIVNKKIDYLNKKKIKNNFISKNINFLNDVRTKYPELINLHALFVDNKLVAANLGINYKKNFYYLLPVLFLEQFNKFSPGKLLLDFLVHFSIINKFCKFDFGYGDENYKKYWSNEFINISTYIYYKTIKGFLIYYFIKTYLFFRDIK